MSPEVSRLEKDLGVQFKNPALLRLALVHPSYVNEHPEEAESNQRLEFLGDSCLGFIVARALYKQHPDLGEGPLTEARSQVVRDETLAKAARRLGIGRHLLLGRGEAARGGSDRPSNLADAFEALVAAVYLDRGYRAAQAFVLRALGDELRSLGATVDGRDPKTLLQELAHSRGLAAPVYRVVQVEGPAHQPTYSIEVLWDGQVVAQGKGSRKIDAERQAARRALEQVG